jgi:NitT/TauT family transport system permease protein
MRNKNKLQSVLLIVSFITIWQLVSSFGLINNAFIPSPINIIEAIFQRDFWFKAILDIIFSLSLLMTSLVLAYLLAIGVTILISVSQISRNGVNISNNIFKYIPAPVFIPIGILFFGVSDVAIVFVVTLTILTVLINYAINIWTKDVGVFSSQKESWRLSNISFWRHFFLPIFHLQIYRVIPSIIIWSLGIIIFGQIVISSDFGFGSSIARYQANYQAQELFLLIIIISVLAFLLEQIFIVSFSRLRLDKIKKLAIVIISILSVIGIIFFATTNFDLIDNSYKTVISYRSIVNLPVFVMIEKFNELNLELELTSSGQQATDSIQAKKSVIAGYSDMPSVLSSRATNNNLLIVSQSVETKDRPILFLISKKDISINQYQNLSSSKIAYFPNSPLIKAGLDFTLLINGAKTSTNEYISSNDPSSLSQAFVSDQIDTMLAIEPFIADIESNSELNRINPKQSVISGIDFKALPLAGLVIDSERINEEDQTILKDNIKKSEDFITQNTDQNYKATGELRDILIKYNINPDSSIPIFQSANNIDKTDINLLITLIKNFDSTTAKQLENVKVEELYL